MIEEKNMRLIELTNAQEGVSKAGNPWRKVTAVFETTGHYPKRIAITCFNAMCEQVALYSPGAFLNVGFDVESRDWTNPAGETKWFTECTARSIVPAVDTAQTPPHWDKPVPPLAGQDEAPKGDLPF